MTGPSSPLIDQRLLAGDPVPPVGSRVRLRASRCPRCAHVDFPARPECAFGHGGTEQIELSSDPVLRLFTEVRYPPPGALIPVPYVVGVLGFSEGIDVLGVVVGAAYDELRIGQPLETVAIAVGEQTGYGARPQGPATARR